MQYMVQGADGKEYGPTDLATLKIWVTEGRITPNTMLRDFLSGQSMPASAVSELFPSSGGGFAPPVGQAYPRGAAAPVYSGKDPGGGAFAGVIVRAVLGLVLFFVLNGIGLIFAGYGLFSAIQLQSSGSKYGIPALVISGLATAAIAVGWMLKLSHMGH